MIVKAENWQRPHEQASDEIRETVKGLLDDIRQRGDEAIAEHSQRFDGFSPEIIELRPFADYSLEPALRTALETAAARIKRFAEFQLEGISDKSFSDEFGTYGQRVVPIENIAGYIPGGRFPLVSTALMTLIPAQVAGCQTRVAVSPSDDTALLAAASLAGATQFIKIGGAQAICALAYGSQWAPPVDMIVGPGNAYVNAAKSLVQSVVKIDTLAGPSELLVIAENEDHVDFACADLLAQSEHDPLALSVLCSWNAEFLDLVAHKLKNHDSGKAMLAKNTLQLVLAENPEQAIAFSNLMAPEHLAVFTHAIDTRQLTQYGALFDGENSAVAFGDYCSGPNHTLPTLAKARQKGGLYVGDFVKVLSYQHINNAGSQALADIGKTMAQAEGLQLHYESMDVRLGKA